MVAVSGLIFIVYARLITDGKFNSMELQSMCVAISDVVSKLRSAYLCTTREELNPQILFVYATLTNIFGISSSCARF